MTTNTEVDMDSLSSAVTGWIGKASAGIDNPELTGPLKSSYRNAKRAMDALENKNGSPSDAIHQLAKAEKTIESISDESLWPNNHA